MKQILFYRAGDAYGEFSNFSLHPIELKRRRWPTAEHYFQAQKFAGTEHEEAIRALNSPMIAARMGRNRALPLRADWEAVKDDVMQEALRAKFMQHPALKALLLSTVQPNWWSIREMTTTGLMAATAAEKTGSANF